MPYRAKLWREAHRVAPSDVRDEIGPDKTATEAAERSGPAYGVFFVVLIQFNPVLF